MKVNARLGEKMVDYTKKITKEYYKQHAVCPECGSGVGTSLVGYIYEPDENYCWCECGWRGICHDLVPDLAAGRAMITIKKFNELKPELVWLWKDQSLMVIGCDFDKVDDEPNIINFYVGGDYNDGMTTAEELFDRGEVFASVKDFAKYILAAGGER